LSVLRRRARTRNSFITSRAGRARAVAAAEAVKSLPWRRDVRRTGARPTHVDNTSPEWRCRRRRVPGTTWLPIHVQPVTPTPIAAAAADNRSIATELPAGLRLPPRLDDRHCWESCGIIRETDSHAHGLLGQLQGPSGLGPFLITIYIVFLVLWIVNLRNW